MPNGDGKDVHPAELWGNVKIRGGKRSSLGILTVRISLAEQIYIEVLVEIVELDLKLFIGMEIVQESKFVPDFVTQTVEERQCMATSHAI